MHGAQANVADTVGERIRLQLIGIGDVEDMPRPGSGRTIGNDLQVIVSVSLAQTFAIATGHDERPPGGR